MIRTLCILPYYIVLYMQTPCYSVLFTALYANFCRPRESWKDADPTFQKLTTANRAGRAPQPLEGTNCLFTLNS